MMRIGLPNREQNRDGGYLDGRLLIAMPVMGDPRFERSVIYLCAHSSEGAMGIIVNRPAGSIDFPELLVQLDIIKKADQSVGGELPGLRLVGARIRHGKSVEKCQPDGSAH